MAAIALAAALWLPGGAAAATKTGQSPDCERFCMSVSPASGTVDQTVFRFAGRGWRPGRRVVIFYGPYCAPGAACPAIAYLIRLRTNSRGGFVFRFREGQAQPGDEERHIHSGGGPVTFEQMVGRPPHTRYLRRQPRYEVSPPAAR